MDVSVYYRILGLDGNAGLGAIKEAYRALARQYHPDVNPGDRHAHSKFIQITEAYKALTEIHRHNTTVNISFTEDPDPNATKIPEPTDVTVQPPPAPPRPKPQKPLTQQEFRLKWRSYQLLQEYLKADRFPRAIALMEGLAQRFPDDPEVSQWQGITYFSWGAHLLRNHEPDKARTFLRKALLVDPYNRKLREQVQTLLP